MNATTNFRPQTDQIFDEFETVIFLNKISTVRAIDVELNTGNLKIKQLFHPAFHISCYTLD